MDPRKRHKTKFPGVWYRESPQGRRYIVHYTDSKRQEHTKTLPLGTTLQEAKAEKGRLEARRANGELLAPTRMTVFELLESYVEIRRDSLKNPYMYDWAMGHLVDEFGHIRATELSPSDVASFIAKLKKEGRKTWTIKKILTPLNGAYKLAIRDGKVPSNPVAKLLPSERPRGDQRKMRCLSGAEINSLSRTCSPLHVLLVFTGLRISEALGLTWDDITEDRVVVRESKTEAGVREVVLAPELRKVLKRHKLAQEPGETRVFPTDRYRAWRELRAACKQANIPEYSLHELRHTFASILIGNGVNAVEVARQMGHANPGITMTTYAHLWDAQGSSERIRGILEDAMGGSR